LSIPQGKHGRKVEPPGRRAFFRLSQLGGDLVPGPPARRQGGSEIALVGHFHVDKNISDRSYFILAFEMAQHGHKVANNSKEISISEAIAPDGGCAS
jgi:hypothetical protein